MKLTHATKLREVLLGSLVLVFLINPLVKVGLEEVVSLVFLEKSVPELLAAFLLLNLHLNVLVGVLDDARFGVHLGKELKLEMVLALQGGGGAGEGQAVWLKVELEVLLGYIRDIDDQGDVVVGVFRGLRRALCPQNYQEGESAWWLVSFGLCIYCMGKQPSLREQCAE